MAETFEGWAIVELMGHRRLAGYVTEEDHFGTAMLRLDVHGLDDAKTPGVTQLYGGSSVYCVTPTSEEIARGLGQRLRPAPVQRYELPAAAPAAAEPDDVEAADDSYEDAWGERDG
jgi:hypothetical protein